MYLLKLWVFMVSNLSLPYICISLIFFSVKKEYSCVWRRGKEQTTGKRKLGWKKGKLFILLYIPLWLSKESSLSFNGVWWICIPSAISKEQSSLYFEDAVLVFPTSQSAWDSPLTDGDDWVSQETLILHVEQFTPAMLQVILKQIMVIDYDASFQW